MTAAEWAQRLEDESRRVMSGREEAGLVADPDIEEVPLLVVEARELAALLRRAERVEAAVDAVAPDLVGATIYVDDVLNGGHTDNLRRASEMLATVRHTLNAALEG